MRQQECGPALQLLLLMLMPIGVNDVVALLLMMILGRRQVLEPRWHSLMVDVQKAATVDEASWRGCCCC